MRAQVINEHRGRTTSFIGGVNRIGRALGPLLGSSSLLSTEFSCRRDVCDFVVS
eukprot:m.166822 g.166822  ORF g.166822 m.166822 type:complete len:54 (+) comp53151_c0_seq3:679-840(+)